MHGRVGVSATLRGLTGVSTFGRQKHILPIMERCDQQWRVNNNIVFILGMLDDPRAGEQGPVLR